MKGDLVKFLVYLLDLMRCRVHLCKTVTPKMQVFEKAQAVGAVYHLNVPQFHINGLAQQVSRVFRVCIEDSEVPRFYSSESENSTVVCKADEDSYYSL